MSEKIIITVMGADKTGIVANVTAYLAEHKINIIDIRQTIFENDIFVMIMLVDAVNSTHSMEEIKADLKKRGEQMEVKIYAQHENIFKYMHRI